MSKLVTTCVSAFVSGLLLFAPSGAGAAVVQPPAYSISGTQVQRLHSKEVGTDYLLYISLPSDYEKKKDSYPLVFVLDADFCFPMVQSITRILGDHDEIQPLIVVGVAYPGVADEKYGPIFKLNRTRDYTPTHVAEGGYGKEFQKLSGGADRYLDFITKELIPHLEKQFRTREDRTIVGYSYGGLLATYAMLTRPGLFQRLVVVSPSLWYDKHVIFRTLEKSKATGRPIAGRAFFAVGGLETSTHGEQDMVKDLDSFANKLSIFKDKKQLKFQVWKAEGETHHSVFPGAAMRGIRWTFSPWR